MSQNLGSLSFLSRFDPSEFYEIAKDLPSTLELNEPASGANSVDASAASSSGELDENISNNNNNGFEIIGTHLLVPQSSILQMIEANKAIIDSTIIDFDSLSNVLPSNEAIPNASSLPSYETFSGQYGFRISIASSEIPVKKSTSWTYSAKLNKLYSIPGVACPVNISVTSMPPFGTIIRAMPIFSKAEHIHDLITRCENHKKSKEFNSDEFPEQSLSHFVRCRHPHATYTQDTSTMRESVCIPFERPTTGSNATTVLYQFMCYSSCIGGSQKPARVVLTLEHNGEILARNSFEVKICACPGRDRTADEKKLLKHESVSVAASRARTNQKPAKVQQQHTETKAKVTTNGTSVDEKTKKMDQISIKSVILPNQEDNEGIFTIKVRGRKNYEILKNLNDALEIQQRIYTKLKKTETAAKLGQDLPTTSGLVKRGSSFIFNSTRISGQSQSQPKTSTETQMEKLPKTLEEFLCRIEMDAYYNLMVAKGIRTIDDLLSSTRKKINSLKICDKDTQTILNKIDELKAKMNNKLKETSEDRAPEAKKPKTNDSFSDLLNSLSRQPSSASNQATDDYVKLSKYQIRYSFNKK